MSGEFREVAHGVEASGTTEGEHTLSWMRADRAADAAGATEQPFTPTEKAFLDFFSQPTETLAATIKGMYPGLSDGESRNIARGFGEDPHTLVGLSRFAAAWVEKGEMDPKGLEIIDKMDAEARHAFIPLLSKVELPKVEG